MACCCRFSLHTVHAEKVPFFFFFHRQIHGPTDDTIWQSSQQTNTQSHPPPTPLRPHVTATCCLFSVHSWTAQSTWLARWHMQMCINTRTHTQRLFTCVKPCVLLSIGDCLIHYFFMSGLSTQRYSLSEARPEEKISRLCVLAVFCPARFQMMQ